MHHSIRKYHSSSPQDNLHLASQIKNVFLDGLGECRPDPVDKFESFLPSFGLGEWKLDSVALSDIAGEEKGCQDREVGSSVRKI